MIDLRPINAILGVFLTLLGAMMLIPAMVDVAAGSDDWLIFAASSAVSVFAGGALWTSGRTDGAVTLSIRQAFLLTTFSWVALAAFGALPFVWSQLDLSYAAAFFEAMSGITTTGATVITGLDNLPPGLLLWRALLQAYGGIGIIVVAIAVLPMLRVGGMQLFRTESSDKSEKIFPAAAQVASSLIGVYLLLNLACALAYAAGGMNAFDAILHAMTTISTGGFSTHDASLGYFNKPAVEWVAIIFMILGALPFVLYIQVLRGRPLALYRHLEVRTFIGVIITAAIILWLHMEVAGLFQGADALRQSMFSVVTLVTTTGFAAGDYSAWGPFVNILLLFVMFLGGCTGSTSGGFKTFRLIILSKVAMQQFRRMIYPSGVFPLTYNRRTVDDDIVTSVFVFFMLYTSAFVVISVAMGAMGLDFLSALSVGATTVANVGPALGPIFGPAGNFASLDAPALWLMSFGMLAGRLELFTVLVLFLPRFWRS